MTQETFNKAHKLVNDREQLKRKREEISNAKKELYTGKIVFTNGSGSSVTLDAPIEIKEHFINELLDYYQKRQEKINAEFQAL